MKRVVLLLVFAMMLLTSCKEYYSKGERIGSVTRFSQKGFVFDSWEGNLNITQTGMNTSGEPFEFSVDNNIEDKDLIAKIDSAANFGWKVKVVYHECFNKNITRSRGETNYFIDDLVVLDRNFAENLKFNNNSGEGVNSSKGGVIDTIYVIIVDKNRLKY